MWWFVAIAFFVLTRLFGLDRAMSIMIWIPVIIGVLFFVVVFFGLVLPSHAWRDR